MKVRLLTRDGRNARVVCWDKKPNGSYPIVALLDNDTIEKMLVYTICGSEVEDFESDDDLMLETPEYLTFKDGDILSYNGGTFILKRLDGKMRLNIISLYMDDTRHLILPV